MNRGAAISLTAWLWDQYPQLIYALARQVPTPLGQCFSCDLDLLSSISCDVSVSASCLFTSISDPLTSTDFSTLGACDLGQSTLTSCTVCIPTLTESDLTPVNTCALAGGAPCGVVPTCTSVTSTDTATSNALQGVAGFLTSAAGLTALAKVASSYFQAQAANSTAKAALATEAAIVNAQTARAAAGKTALPIQYVANGATGTTTPMISTKSGLVPLTASTLASLTPSSVEVFLAQYGMWMVIGGAAAFLVYAATRERRST